MLLYSLFVAYLLCLVAVIGDSKHELKDERSLAYAESLVKCISSAGLTDGEYAQALAGNATAPVLDKAKCTHACILKTHGIIDGNGTVNETNALEHMMSTELGADIEIQRGSIVECSKIREKNECETAQKLLECLNITPPVM